MFRLVLRKDSPPKPVGLFERTHLKLKHRNLERQELVQRLFVHAHELCPDITEWSCHRAAFIEFLHIRSCHKLAHSPCQIFKPLLGSSRRRQRRNCLSSFQSCDFYASAHLSLARTLFQKSHGSGRIVELETSQTENQRKPRVGHQDEATL